MVGSRTALLPYTRERWFENHKILSAVDKLHKLYSMTLPPVVWARSTGLEVINELDIVKAALMITAGGGWDNPQMNRRTWGWGVVGESLGKLSSAGDAVKVAGSGLVGVAGLGLQQLGGALSRIDRK